MAAAAKTQDPSAPGRCAWCADVADLVVYHDREWGVPVSDDHDLFEKLLLDGAQAGLSWLTILRKRAGYRRAFDGFDAEAMARYTAADVERLLADPGIVRNRAKVEAAIANARGFLAIQERDGSFSDFLWRFVGHQPIQNAWTAPQQVPAWTETSRRMSRELKKQGFGFVGPTICYAFMQAVGMVNDHLVSCFRHAQVRALANGRG